LSNSSNTHSMVSVVSGPLSTLSFEIKSNHGLQKSVKYYTIAINVHYQFLMISILTKIE
jgi:hypothetical protein